MWCFVIHFTCKANRECVVPMLDLHSFPYFRTMKNKKQGLCVPSWRHTHVHASVQIRVSTWHLMPLLEELLWPILTVQAAANGFPKLLLAWKSLYFAFYWKVFSVEFIEFWVPHFCNEHFKHIIPHFLSLGRFLVISLSSKFYLAISALCWLQDQVWFCRLSLFSLL